MEKRKLQYNTSNVKQAKKAIICKVYVAICKNIHISLINIIEIRIKFSIFAENLQLQR